jgi:hypothetical protein
MNYIHIDHSIIRKRNNVSQILTRFMRIGIAMQEAGGRQVEDFLRVCAGFERKSCSKKPLDKQFVTA